MIKNNYINSLANLAPWNMTTVIRTHYLIKPHVMDRKVNRMTKSSKIKNVFYVLENDYEIGLKEKSLRINHAHLLIAGDSSLTRYELAKLVGINSKAVLEIENIKSTKAICKYITKYIHHNDSPLYIIWLVPLLL